MSGILALVYQLAYDADMKVYLLALLCLPGLLQAEIYRSVDKDGNVTFTDEPDSQAEKIELQELPTYEATPMPILPVETAITEPEPDLKKPKYKISITSPEQNQSIWAGGGALTASVSVKPALSSDRADKLQFKLDGKNVGEPQTGLSYTFDNINRGSHILAVSIVDKNGKTLKTSKSVLFHMHRRSLINNPNNANNSNSTLPPPQAAQAAPNAANR